MQHCLPARLWGQEGRGRSLIEERVSLLVFSRIFTCVSFCRALNLGWEFVASGLRFIEELLAQRRGFGNGRSEVKMFRDLHNPCHLILVGPQADVVHPRLVSVVGLV